MTFTARLNIEGDFLRVEIPASNRPDVQSLVARCFLKHNSYGTVSVSTPHIPRTTGWKSQNHAIHGFGEQLARWTADGTTKREIIEEAMARAEIPHVLNRFGRQVFKHEADLSVEEAGAIIKELKEIAQFLGCVLEEGEGEHADTRRET